MKTHKWRSLVRGLGSLFLAALFLAATGCQEPVGSAAGDQQISRAATAAVAAWAPGVAYTAGQQATYNGVVYTCVQGHTSMTGWEPPNVPALWTPVSTVATPTPTPKVSPTPTPSIVPPPTTLPTPTPTAKPTATPTATPTPKVSPTPTPSIVPPPTTLPTPTPTAKPTATPTATPTPTPSGTLTLGALANPNGRYYTGYYESWSDNDFTSSGLTDNAIYQASQLCQVPGPVTHVMVAFAQPDFTWKGISANSWDGTGIQFTSNPKDIAQSIRILHELGRKVILSVGGATYTNWSTLAGEAGKTGTPTKTALTQILTDLNFDGLDVDYETTQNSDTDTTTQTQYANAIQAMREAVDAAGSGKLLTLAGWSTGADYTPSTLTQAGSPGVATYWGGNAGRERHVFQMKVSTGAYAGKTVVSLLNMVNVMSYDAGYQNYDPVVAFNEYRALTPSTSSVGIGLEIPPEAWGGATLVLYNSDAGAAGTLVTMDQYNGTNKGAFSVQRFVGAVLANTANANAHDGAMVWDLCITTSPTDANANTVSASIGTLYGWTSVAP